MVEHIQCWIISVQGSPSPEEAYQELKEIVEKFKGCSVAKFNIPKMKGGSFDYLIKATEEVPKLETESESLVGRLGVNLATVLEKPMLEQEDISVGGETLKEFLFSYKWDLNKYPVTQNLDTIFGLLRKQMRHVEQLRDTKVRKYMLVHELLNRCEKRRQGPLTTRNYLGDIVTEEDFILKSDFLKTLLVAVPRALQDQWYASYERLHEEIVPRSTKIISEEEDYVLFSFVVFGRCEKEVRECAKKLGFVIRDYNFKENEMFEFNQEISILYSENNRLQFPLINWLKTHFGEIYAAYIHIKAVKVHIESLLRYGPTVKHQLPTTEEEWKEIAGDSDRRWHFPRCMGALDGKHVVIQRPENTTSEYFNYKGTQSIVLMALVDANYRFTWVNVGFQGRISDGGVFKNSSLYNKMEKGALKIPPDAPLPGRESPIPYVIVADDAFALQPNVMKPFPNDLSKGSPERV